MKKRTPEQGRKRQWRLLLGPASTNPGLAKFIDRAMWTLIEYEASSDNPDKTAIRHAEEIRALLREDQ